MAAAAARHVEGAGAARREGGVREEPGRGAARRATARAPAAPSSATSRPPCSTPGSRPRRGSPRPGASASRARRRPPPAARRPGAPRGRRARAPPAAGARRGCGRAPRARAACARRGPRPRATGGARPPPGDTFWYGRGPRSIVAGSVGTTDHIGPAARRSRVRGITRRRESRVAFPALFVSHGAPTAALDDDDYTQALGAWARARPRPRAIVVVSAHAEARGPVRGERGGAALAHLRLLRLSPRSFRADLPGTGGAGPRPRRRGGLRRRRSRAGGRRPARVGPRRLGPPAHPLPGGGRAGGRGLASRAAHAGPAASHGPSARPAAGEGRPPLRQRGHRPRPATACAATTARRPSPGPPPSAPGWTSGSSRSTGRA